MFLKKVVRLGLQYRQVSHQNHEFSKRVATTSPNLSNWGGTQCMDRWWLSLKSFVPSSCNWKSKNSEEGSILHPNIQTYVFQWVWREHVLKGQTQKQILDMLSALF